MIHTHLTYSLQGKKRCSADFQQPVEKTDRFSMANSGTFMCTRRYSFQLIKWVLCYCFNGKKLLVKRLVYSYEQPEVALNCGLILRECIRHEALAKILLYSSKFYQFFDYVEMSTFDIASDAFASFKEILTKHKPMVADFLELNYDEVCFSLSSPSLL